jgi:hypothetical protein
MLSGKSSLFGAITGQSLDPTRMGKEQLATVHVPDPRLKWLAEHYKPKKLTEASFEVLDIPGFSQETPQQQAEFKRHVPNLRTCDGLVAVVRAFEDDAVPPYRNRIDPVADIDELYSELVFADLEVATRRIERLEKDVHKPTPTQDQDKRQLILLGEMRDAWEAEQPYDDSGWNVDDRKLMSSFAFLSHKPLVVVVNVGEADVSSPPTLTFAHARTVISCCAQVEQEIAQLDEDDRRVFMEDLGLAEPARDRLIHACYEALGLISFLTYGEDECRAWTIPNHASAVEAASKIHSDIARGFIRAETVAFEDLRQAGDMKAAKAAGKIRLEGKTYPVADGDCITFRFSV